MCITYLSRDSCRNLICKNLGYFIGISLVLVCHFPESGISSADYTYVVETTVLVMLEPHPE